MSDKLDRLVAEKVVGIKWYRAIPSEWFYGHGRDSLLAHCLAQNAAFMLTPEQAKDTTLIKESDGNGMTVMHPEFRPMEGVCNRWGKPKTYSTSIAAAWEVVEHLRKQTLADGLSSKYQVSLIDDGEQWECLIEDNGSGECCSGFDESPSLAICYAALAALNVPEATIQEACK